MHAVISRAKWHVQSCLRYRILESHPEMIIARSLLKIRFFIIDSSLKRHVADHPECEDMGTTLSCLIIEGDSASIAHVGDSRIYRLRGGSLEQLTDNHTFVQE